MTETSRLIQCYLDPSVAEVMRLIYRKGGGLQVTTDEKKVDGDRLFVDFCVDTTRIDMIDFFSDLRDALNIGFSLRNKQN